MGEKRVDPTDGKFKIRGTGNRDLELTLEDKDLKKYIVEELDGDDMSRKLPSSTPVPIQWFACFSIYKNRNGRKDGYATVPYSFTLNMEGIERLFIGIGGSAVDVTDEIKNSGRVKLSEGDPPVGHYP